MSDLSLDHARQLDAADPLRHLRNEFDLPTGLIYLDGNSLGAMPRASAPRMAQMMKEWSQDLITGWNIHGWYHAPMRVGDKLARLLGAEPGEIVVADSTSINLYKCLAAALQLAGDRTVILSEPGNFPTDLYLAQGIERIPGSRARLKLVESEKILDSIDPTVAVVMLTHVHYKSARMHDMKAITRRAHECGALIIWDLSHSAGAVEVDLNDAEADFAVGCGYKYLNGGPGCPGFLFVAKRHQNNVLSPLTGWMGHAQPFEFSDDYRPAPGITRFLCGSHPVSGIVTLEVGVDLILTADRRELWAKSQRLCDLFMRRVESQCAQFGVTVEGSRDSSKRGSHVSLHHPEGYAVVQCLVDCGVIGDFRMPDLIRFGFTPLYVSYEDVWNASECLYRILRDASWDQEEFRKRKTVT